MTSSTPHDNEYLAAVAGMQETYGTPTHAIGDRVCYRLRDWRTGYENGRVIGHGTGHTLIVQAEDDGTRRLVDGRPMPDGELLPF